VGYDAFPNIHSKVFYHFYTIVVKKYFVKLTNSGGSFVLRPFFVYMEPYGYKSNFTACGGSCVRSGPAVFFRCAQKLRRSGDGGAAGGGSFFRALADAGLRVAGLSGFSDKVGAVLRR